MSGFTQNSLGATGSSTDDAVVRFDGTDGGTIQNSGITIDDSDNLSIPSSSGYLISTDLQLSRSAAGVLSISDPTNSADSALRLYDDTGSSFGGITITGSGQLNFSSSAYKVHFSQDDMVVAFGGSSDAYFEWNTNDHTNDSMLLALSGTSGASQSKSFLLVPDSSNFDHAAEADPTLFIHSNTTAGTATDEWIKFQHDGTNGVIDVGSGTVSLPGINLASSTTVTSVLDEDDLSTDSATALATQQSIKAYVDASAGAPTPQLTFATIFETAGRFTQGKSASGIISFNGSAEGVTIGPGTSSGGYAEVYVEIPGVDNACPFVRNSYFSAQFKQTGGGLGNSNQFFIGVTNGAQLTVAGTGITFTSDDQYGFKNVYTGGAQTWSATNANGTTETSTALTAVTHSLGNQVTAILDVGTNIKYYVNGSLEATHTTNLPASATAGGATMFQAATSNVSTTNGSQWLIGTYNFSQDAF